MSDTMSNDFSGVSIPDNLQRTIQDIKEIAAKHNDEDIYTMLKECNMDPNETAQKLLYLDTFHEVKKKRERRKFTVDRRSHEEYRRASDMQEIRARDVGFRRRSNARNDDGYIKPLAKTSKSFTPAPRKTKDHSAPGISSFIAHVSGSSSLSNGSYSHDLATQLAKHDIRGSNNNSKAHGYTKSRKFPSLPIVLVKQLTISDPGPTPHPTPTDISSQEEATTDDRNLKKQSTQVGSSLGSPSVSGLYSSATDPVLVPSLNPRNSASVGIIKRETTNQRNNTESSAVIVGQTVPGSIDSTSNAQKIEFHEIEKSHMTKSSRMPTSTSHRIIVADGNRETNPVQQVNEPSKGNLSSHKETSKVDIKLQNSTQKSVIFPNHLQVPEAYKNSLTFGSLNTPLEQNSEKSNPRDVTGPTNADSIKRPSLDGIANRPRSPSHELVDSIRTQDKASSDAIMRYEQSKQETSQPVGGSQNSLLPIMPDYGFSVAPSSIVGSNPVQVEGHEPQAGNSPSTTCSAPYVAQPMGIAQSSIAVSPPLFPFLRQPYQPNYIPYNPYFSQLYMPPQNVHQLLTHSGLHQQLETGNIYIPPTVAAASGLKLPIPPISPLYKPENLSQYGISSSYGSYGASGLGYSSGAALPPDTSTSNDELGGSELTDKKFYSMNKQNESLHVMTPAKGRDIPSLQSNVVYNLPQGQPLPFSPAQISHNSFQGLYHPTQTQTMSTPSLVQSLPQSHVVGGTIESIVSPPSSYLHQQLQPLPQHSQPQQGQMNWNQKVMNKDNL